MPRRSAVLRAPVIGARPRRESASEMVHRRLVARLRGDAGNLRRACDHRRMESPTTVTVLVEPPRRYDPPHILWYFGAITAALAASATVASVHGSHRGIWQLLVGIVLAAVFTAGAVLLLRAGWRVPGGVLVAAAVTLVPAVGQAFERLIGVWPALATTGVGVFQDFQGAYFALGLATIFAGLAGFALVRFPFVFVTVTVAALLTAQLLVPVFVDSPGLDDHASAVLVTGAVLLLVGLVLDSVARGDDAFWWHVTGLFGLAVGLTWYAFVRDSTWAWLTILVIAAVLILGSAPFGRATWASFGVLGVFGAMLHYDLEWTGSWRSPALMVLVSLGLILLGMVLQLYARLWVARLGRPAAAAPVEPPPASVPPPAPEPPPEATPPATAEPADDEPPPGEPPPEEPPTEAG
jgi:hypothetical protein